MTTGYSGNSLSQKLGIKAGDTVLAIDPPADYAALLEPLPKGVRIAENPDDDALVHAFCGSRAALDAAAARLVTLPRVGGALWIS